LLDRGAPSREGAFVRLRGTEPAAVGTGLWRGESLSLLVEEQLASSFGKPLGGRGGDLLPRSEIDVETGALVAEGSFGDNCGPRGRELVELLEFLGCKLRSGPSSFAPEVMSRTAGAFPIPRQDSRKARANRDVASQSGR